jgi:hypothetical protein
MKNGSFLKMAANVNFSALSVGFKRLCVLLCQLNPVVLVDVIICGEKTSSGIKLGPSDLG